MSFFASCSRTLYKWPPGVCFGHQILAMALGGTCENNNNKLEVGPSDVILTDIGKKVFGGKDTLVSLRVLLLLRNIF